MAEMTNFMENSVINHYFRNTAYTPVATLYMALHTADPTETGAVGEVTGNAYQRTAVTMGAPTDGVSTNSADVTFPTATPAGWGSIAYTSIWDAQTVGNCLMYSPVDTAKTINAGDTAKYNAGQISITLT